MNCISCNFEHDEKFCPNCGERSEVKKITFTSILQNVFSSITNMDKGFLYNIKTLILNPQKITIDYVLGKRKGILNPVSFLIFSITIYLFVITFLKAPVESLDDSDFANSKVQKVGMEVGLFIRTNLKFFWILSIIPLGISLKLMFKQYNYIEHLAISSFIIAQATLIGIISYLVFRFPLIFDPFVYLVILWLIYKIFRNDNDIFESILYSITIFVLFMVQLVVIVGIIGTAKFIW